MNAMLLSVLSVCTGILVQPAELPTVQVGDTPACTFRTPLVRGMGVKSLADLRGKPVLVQFWYHGWQVGVDETMKIVLELQHEYGDELQIIFANRRLSAERTERMLLEKGWLGTNGMWTSQRPFLHGDKYEPHFVLLSAEGEVIHKSRPLENPLDIVYTPGLIDDLEDALQLELERLRTGPPDNPRALEKAWIEFARGKLARGLELAEKLQTDEESSTELRNRAGATSSTFGERIARCLTRAEWLLEHGCILQCDATLEPLAGQLARVPDLQQRRDALLERRDSAELAQERRADKALASLEKKLFVKGADVRSVNRLLTVSRKYAGTQRGAEAARLAAILGAAE